MRGVGRNRPQVSVALLVAGLLLAACGSDDASTDSRPGYGVAAEPAADAPRKARAPGRKAEKQKRAGKRAGRGAAKRTGEEPGAPRQKSKGQGRRKEGRGPLIEGTRQGDGGPDSSAPSEKGGSGGGGADPGTEEGLPAPDQPGPESDGGGKPAPPKGTIEGKKQRS